MADSSTLAMPSITSPSRGMISPASHNIHHALFYVDIRIAGHAEETFFLNRLFAKDAGRKVQK